ncbi:MAG TPA: hypothetical protein VKI17_00420 [Gemmataceae bacterium]|nr:hypothetical protein [Gemmataceae bacterium]
MRTKFGLLRSHVLGLSLSLSVVTLLTVQPLQSLGDNEGRNFRQPTGDTELRNWLENMVWYHRFTTDEVSVATGLKAEEVLAALNKFGMAQPSSRAVAWPKCSPKKWTAATCSKSMPCESANRSCETTHWNCFHSSKIGSGGERGN